MKIKINNVRTKDFANVPDGDLFLIGAEMYIKMVPVVIKTKSQYLNSTVNAVSTRTGEAKFLGSKTQVNGVKSIVVDVESDTK